MDKKKMNSNIWKLYLIKALSSFMLTVPIIVLFLQENGLTMKQIFLLESLFSLAVISLDIPTGYFSDVFGRKKTIIIGGILATIGFGIYSISHSFLGFLVAEITLGFGIGFISGSDSAMLYDTLLEEGAERNYKKTEGTNSGIGIFSESVSSIIGGFLALVSLRFPFYWDALVTFMVIPVAFMLVEPKRHVLRNEERGLKNMISLIKFSIHDHKELKWLIIYSAVATTSTLTMFWFIQPYLLANHVPLKFFGMILAGLLLIASFVSWKSDRIEKFLGRRKALILMIALPALGYFLLVSFWSVWAIIFIALFYVVRGLNNPVTLYYVNGLISSDKRATILSVRNLTGRLIFATFGPIAGWMNDSFSLKTALLFSGVAFLIFGLISLTFLRKHKAL